MRLACIDVGLKRIGTAISPDGKVVLPQDAVLRKNRKQAAADVDAFLREWGIDTLIVGLPKGGSSSEEMQRRIKHFVSLLGFEKQIIFFDEYGSSEEAKEQTKGVFRHKKDGKIDSMAAKIILERYIFDKAATNS
ncbi:MAG: Holliday junction resolvase RuvX [Campylobacterota bacterium]